ncbi:MAG TPA: YitT family protein [Virgibacillus sp.]|nr:YitT family protein [Virgibacillus sp.]
MRKELYIRWLFFFIGLTVLGLGVALTVKGQKFGVGSWDVLHIGLFNQLGLSIGLWSIIMGVLIITISSIGLREFPKIGTFANMTCVGIFIDLFNWLIPNPDTLLTQFIAFFGGVLLMAAGAGIYISAHLGAGPRDSLMLVITKKFNSSIAVSRTIMEICVAVIGYLLGGPIGIGTVIITFALGPVIQITLKHSEQLLNKSLSGQGINSTVPVNK